MATLKARTGETVPYRSRGAAPTIILLVAISMSVFTIHEAHAPGETYNLTLSSSRVQEYNTPGVTLYLNVTGANTSSNYHFNFTVTDPSGARANATTLTIPTQATFVTSVLYPKDFGTGAGVRYVGNYTINVAQTQPGNKPTVATGRFVAGITDNVTYQRTYQISMKAEGYAASESITITLSQGTGLVQGFPLVRAADANGSLSFPWQIPPDAAAGNYRITLTGSTTTKNPADIQTFTVNPTGVTVPGLTVNNPTIARTLTQQFLFAPQYPSGQRVQTGWATVRIAEPDGVTHVYTNGTFDSLTGTFRATYRLPPDAVAGIWVATIDADQFNDGYGNKGPSLTVAAGFYLQPATLDVAITAKLLAGITFNAGDVIPIYASVKYPDGSLFNSGVVVAKLSHGGVVVGTPVTLSYIPGQQEWAGSYQVNSNDPSGIWLVTVDASDQPGNTGEEILSTIVSIPPSTLPPSQPSGLNTSSFLLVAAIVAAVALGVLLMALLIHRKKLTRTEVKLDLRVVDKEVDRIQDSAFFQRVKKQVEDKKGPESDEPSGRSTDQ